MSRTATSVDLSSSTALMRPFHLAWLVFLSCFNEFREFFAFCASVFRLPQAAFAAPAPADAIPFPKLSFASCAYAVRFTPEHANKAQLR